MSIPTYLVRTLGCAALACSAVAAVASGGGGGSMPSESAPQYDPAVEYRNGIAALQEQRWADADRAFGRVLSVAPRDANTNYLMALSKIGRNNYKSARSYLEKAVKIDPKMIAGHEQLGIALAKLGEADKAKEQLDWFTVQEAACATTCTDAAVLQQGSAAVKAAIDAGKQAHVAVPGLLMFASTKAGDGAYLAAVSLINEHRYEDAIVSLQGAEQVFGPHPDILTYLGFANRKLKRYDIAEGYYRRALAVAPWHRGATEYYGEMMLERGDVPGATRMLAQLDAQCTFGCAEADELRRWIVRRSSAS